MRYDVIALGAFLAVILWYMYRRHRRAVRFERRAMYDDCLELFESYRITQDDVAYPVLSGRYRGHRIKLNPIPDYMAFRKIPSLWLQVTVVADIPYEGTFDFLMRPANVEFYSPSWKLWTVLFPNPPGWPVEATLRTDDRENMPPIDLITPHIDLFDDLKSKELLITPRGVRIVYQADQARRSHYMVLRQLIFENFRLHPILVSKLLDRAIAIRDDLCRKAKDDQH